VAVDRTRKARGRGDESADPPLQRDCVKALSRGGRYTLDNIVPACGSCNTSKCNREVTRWLRRKRLDEGAFLLRHVEMKTALALRRTL
jgi:5-methylcytosine-specific restriction endonuclease McrA